MASVASRKKAKDNLRWTEPASYALPELPECITLWEWVQFQRDLGVKLEAIGQRLGTTREAVGMALSRYHRVVPYPAPFGVMSRTVRAAYALHENPDYRELLVECQRARGPLAGYLLALGIVAGAMDKLESKLVDQAGEDYAQDRLQRSRADPESLHSWSHTH